MCKLYVACMCTIWLCGNCMSGGGCKQARKKPGTLAVRMPRFSGIFDLAGKFWSHRENFWPHRGFSCHWSHRKFGQKNLSCQGTAGFIQAWLKGSWMSKSKAILSKLILIMQECLFVLKSLFLLPLPTPIKSYFFTK